MTVLAPWALVVGVLAAAGAVVLHLVARQRPAAYLLPTTRFIPDRRTLVSRIATRPRDLLLLALRVLLLLSAAAAFARPVLAPRRVPRARLVLLDRSAAVAQPAAALARTRELLGAPAFGRLILFDTAAAPMPDAGAALDSLARASSARAPVAGSVTAALVAARRAGPALATDADSVELIVVSPLTHGELDAATDSVRARWPGRVTIVRVAPSTDSAATAALERAPGADDPLAPALARLRVAPSATSVRLRRGAPTAADTAFARTGGVVVAWDTAGAARVGAQAVAMGDDVVVAAVGRGRPASAGRPLARWGDGEPAASEQPIGRGCIRQVAIVVPLAGDLPLRPAFQRVVRGLAARCGAAAAGVAADSAVVARLGGAGPLAGADELAGRERAASPLVAWLLALALACALAELLVRARSEPEPA